MKRSAYEEDDWDSGDATCVFDGSVMADGQTSEKRQRSVGLPTLVGPLTFAPDGSQLQQAVLPLRPSSMPGVYRLQARVQAPLRLWVPGLAAPLDTDVRALLGAIQYQCIFIFDTSMSGAPGILEANWLLTAPAVQKCGVVVSKLELAVTPPLPFIQDSTGALMTECHVYDYLGPSAVCIRNGELVGTMMLQRSPENVLQTLQQWS